MKFLKQCLQVLLTSPFLFTRPRSSPVRFFDRSHWLRAWNRLGQIIVATRDPKPDLYMIYSKYSSIGLLAKIIISFFYKYISYNSSFGFPVKVVCTFSWCRSTSICIYKHVVNSSNLISSKYPAISINSYYDNRAVQVIIPPVTFKNSLNIAGTFRRIFKYHK